MALDSAVARLGWRFRLLERAVHDPSRWTMTALVDGRQIEVPARRILECGRIIFLARFPAGTPSGSVMLRCPASGDLPAIEHYCEVSFPAGAADVRWVLTVDDREPAAA